MKTSEAIGTIIRCHAIIVVNAARAIDRLVKAQPWAFIIGCGLIVFVASGVGVGNARAERDHANKQMVALQDTLDNYKLLVESYQYKYNR